VELVGGAGARGVMARLARLVLGTLGLLSIVAFTALSAVRLLCPIELGNGEGMMLDHAIRIAQGQPLYVAPSLDFIPFVYMPMFSWLVAILVKIFGPALWEGRLVDLVGVAGFVGVLMFVVRRETRSWALALAGAGIFLMGHGLTRGGYDVVRPDPVMLMFVFAALAVLRFTTTTRGAVIAALLASLGFFAKQHGILFGIAGIPYLLFSDRRRLAPYTATLLGTCVGGYLLMMIALGPWFQFYTWDVPSHWSQFSRGRVVQYLGEMLIGKLGPMVIPSVLVFGATGAARGGAPEEAKAALERARAAGHRGSAHETIWGWGALAGIGTGLMASLDPYAYYHTLMPTVCAFSVLGPIALDRLGRRLDGGVAGRATTAACVVLAFQFLPLLYPMRTLLPRPGAAATRRDFVARLRALPGRVLMPYHGFYLTEAGKGMGFSVLPLDDVIRAHGNRLLRNDPGYFDRMFEPLRHGPNRPLIVNDSTFAKTGDASIPLWASLEPGYRKAGDMGDLIERLRPLAGSRNSPTWIYAPVDSGGTEP
jgi:hypothetical protein